MANTQAHAILASYEERQTELEVDDEADELSPLRNRSSSDFNREKVSQLGFSFLGVIASLTRVQYGLWNNAPAALIGWRFQFHGGNNSLFRFRKATLFIEFTSRPASDPDSDPRVLDFGPKHLQAQATTEQLGWHYEGTFSAQATIGALTVGPQIRGGKDGTYERRYAERVESDDWSNSKHRFPNCVKVWLSENSRQETGLPLNLHVATIVSYTSPFQARVNISASPIERIVMKGAPWRTDDPVLFEPGIEPNWQKALERGGVPVTRFEGITGEEWQAMVTPDLPTR